MTNVISFDAAAYFVNSNPACTVTYTIVDSSSPVKRAYIASDTHFGVITLDAATNQVQMKQASATYTGGSFTAYIKATTNAADGLTTASMAAYTTITVTEYINPCIKGVPTLSEAEAAEITFTGNEVKSDTISTSFKASNYITNSNTDCIVTYSIVNSNKQEMESGDKYYSFITVEKDGGVL